MERHDEGYTHCLPVDGIKVVIDTLPAHTPLAVIRYMPLAVTKRHIALRFTRGVTLLLHGYAIHILILMRITLALMLMPLC